MRKLLLALMTTLALLFVSACGSDDSGGSGDEGSVGEDKGVELTQENFAEEISKAQLDARTAHMSMEIDMGGATMPMEGDTVLDEDPAEVAMALTMDMSAIPGAPEGQSMDMRMVDQVMYMNMGDLTQGKFVKFDLTDESNPLGAEFGDILDQSNPAAQIDAMNEAMTSFEEAGDGGEIDGVSTTKYNVTLDAAQMMEAQGTDPSTMAGVPESFEYVMYIGDDNLPRRMEMEIPGAGTTTLNWSKWGEDVTVEAPADDEITDQDPFGGAMG